MKRTRVILLFALFAIFLVSCKKEKITERIYPRLRALSVEKGSDNCYLFKAEVISYGEGEIIDHGFVWSTLLRIPMVEREDILSLGKPSSNIDVFKGSSNSGFVLNQTHHFRPYIRTSEIIVYGDILEFMPKNQPEIKLTDITPDHGSISDTVTIQGQYMSRIDRNIRVYFDNIEAEVLGSSDSTIITVVPEGLSNTDVVVTGRLFGTIYSLSQLFTLSL